MHNKLLGVVVVGAFAAAGFAGCGDDDSSTGASGSSDPAPSAGAEILHDEFDDDANGWGEFDEPGGSNSFEDGDYVWEFPIEPGRPHFLPDRLLADFEAGEVDLTDVVVEAKGTVTDGDATIGVFCRDVEDPQADADVEWYEFVVNDGFAAIRRADNNTHIEELTSTEDVSIDAGAEITVGGACVEDDSGELRLWLTLDGETLLDATDDDPLPVGPTGVTGYATPDSSEPIVVRWHEFTVSAPEATD